MDRKLESMNYYMAAVEPPQHRQASIRFTRAILHDPNESEFYPKWAGFLGKQELYKQSEQKSSIAIQMNPMCGEAYYTWGVALMFQDKYQAAKLKLNKAAEIDPLKGEIYFVLGRIFSMQKNYEKAEEKLRKAFELRPTEFQICNQLLNVLLRQKKFKQAEKLCEEAVKRIVGMEMQIRWGDVFYEQEKYLEARVKYIAVHEIQEEAELSLKIGDTHLAQLEYNEAESWYRKAIAKDPSDVEGYERLINVLIKQERYEEAQALEKANREKSRKVDIAGHKCSFHCFYR